MFGGLAKAQQKTEIVRDGYEVVTKEVHVGSSKSGLTQTVTTKVPHFKKVTKTVYCMNTPHFYCPEKTCGGSSGEGLYRIASTQGSAGSPSIGLIPTMATLPP